MKISDVKALVQEQIETAYRTAYENAAKVCEASAEDAGSSPCSVWLEEAAKDIRALPIPTVMVIRPETAALKPETVTPHTIIAGQGLHPVTDEIIDRKRLTPAMVRKAQAEGIFGLKYENPGPDPIARALMSIPMERR